MDTQLDKELKPEDVMRASWFARLALGNYSSAPQMPEKDALVNPVFKKRAIDLCN